jgi:hypothetical protein
LTGTYQLLVYAVDVNLSDGNIDTVKENAQTLMDSSKVVGLEVIKKKMISCCLLNKFQGKIMT